MTKVWIREKRTGNTKQVKPVFADILVKLKTYELVSESATEPKPRRSYRRRDLSAGRPGSLEREDLTAESPSPSEE